MRKPAAMAETTPAAKPPKSELRETIAFLIKLAVIVLVFRSFLFSPYSIPSESMLPRLYVGDYLFVSKWSYGYSRWSLPAGLPLIPGRILPHTPARGDVVVFRGPPSEGHDVIKRVIGLPGDSVQVQGGQVILNGRKIPKVPEADFVIPVSPNYGCLPEFQDIDAQHRPVCRYKQFRETLPDGKSYDVLDRGDYPAADDTDVYTVPAGHVFVMGDNRDDSADSRFPAPEGMGYVPMDRLEGKAVLSFFSTDGSASWLLPWTWFTAARWQRIGQGF